MRGPRHIGSILAGWMPGRGSERGQIGDDRAAAAFAAAWEQAVGSDVARRSRPTRFRGGILTVLTANSTWSDELSLHAPKIITALQRAFPDVRLHKLRFVVASGRTKRLLDAARMRIGARGRQRPVGVSGYDRKQATPASADSAAGGNNEDLAAKVMRLAAHQRSLDEARDRAGWKMCPACGRRFLPESCKAAECAPCADAARATAQAVIERTLIQAPWLSLAQLRQVRPETTSGAYDRARRHLLTRWQSGVEAAERRLRRGALTGEDRVVAWSFLMLQTGLAQRDIGRAVVTDVLGSEWTNVLFATTAAHGQQARRSARENHK